MKLVARSRLDNQIAQAADYRVGYAWSLDALLASLPIALVVLGPILLLPIGGRSLPIYASQIAIALLFVHLFTSQLALRKQGLADHHHPMPTPIKFLIFGVFLLAIPLYRAADPAAGLLAYLNFASGSLGAIALASVWRRNVAEYSWIDLAYVVFASVGVAQLLMSFRQADSINALHQSSQTPWGNSNFVAGCLVVVAFIIIGRSGAIGKYRLVSIAAGAAIIGTAMLTLSRGAAVAACIGGMCLLWSKFGPRISDSAKDVRTRALGQIVRMALRGLAVLLPFGAFLIVDWATTLRAVVNTQVHENVDTRLAMYELAWNEFLRAPFTGTGWASFREASLANIGQSQTFAHNSVLSLLQIGGMLSLPFLLSLAFLIYHALKGGGPYTAAIAASVTISMTDPFFESLVGNLLAIPFALVVLFSVSDDASAGPNT